MEDIIHWVTEHKDESPPKRKVNHSHPDPTANEAIGNVIREERRKNRPKETPAHRCLAGRGGEAGCRKVKLKNSL